MTSLPSPSPAAGRPPRWSPPRWSPKNANPSKPDFLWLPPGENGHCVTLMTPSWSPPCRSIYWQPGILVSTMTHCRRPVPGMAGLLERLTRAHPDAPVIHLSTGAWNVAPTLHRFLTRHLYPRGAFLLTDWGPTHDRWFRNGFAMISQWSRTQAPTRGPPGPGVSPHHRDPQW
jgi:hypothetical protein